MRQLKHFFLLTFTLMSLSIFAQQTPTTGGAFGGGQFWRRGGNSNVGGGAGNIFGTQYNSPIYTIAGPGGAADFRMKLNGAFNVAQYSVGGYNTGMNRSGYLLLGSMAGYSSVFTGANFGAYSLLHLNGANGDFVQTGGYRPWMQTGITYTDNDDLSYMGLRAVGVGDDVTETTIAWSDNSGGTSGPDQMVFRFISGNVEISGAVANSVSNNLLANNDLDGLHVVRYTATGFMGLGNTFGIGNPIYVQPQSLSHLSLSDNRDVWTQYTNRTTSAVGSGTGETAADGLRIGIISETTFGSQGNGTAMIYNQENRPILFSTNNNTNSATSTNTNERVRIMNVNTPTELPTGNLGIYNPAGINGNFTRMSVSHNPANPVTRPLSLLHLGYNTGQLSLTGASTDGWRNWMDIGTFTTNGTDNIYVGLKNEGLDKFDAIINWGDNQTDSTFVGPDHLRFIFTSTTTATPPGNGSPVAVSNNGLEIARMVPIYDTTVTEAWVATMNGNGNDHTYGRVGIGDFTAQGVDEEPTHKLDVVGNGRFRFLPDSLYFADTTVTKYVMVDSMGVLRWSSTPPPSGYAACNDPAGDLQFDSHVDLNDYRYYFEGQGPIGGDQVGIGYDCGTFLPGKLSVTVVEPGVSFGVFSYVDAVNFNNVGGVFRTVNATNFNFGVQSNGAGGLNGYGGNFGGQGSSLAYGVYAFGASAPGGTAIGVYGTAGGGTNNYAGYFDGAVVATSFALIPSDENLKDNIVELPSDSASYYINALNPSTFNFQTANYSHMNLSEGHQYGLIAQEVEQVLPSLVNEVTSPAHYDSLGNEISPAMTFKTLSYEQFIPILIADAQNKNQALDSLSDIVVQQDSLINDLNVRLTTLENCLSSILPLLCQINNTMIQQNDGAAQDQLKTMLNVELRDENAIVLEQNVPNPFAEQTIINYSIPQTVQRAQILFYNQNGQLIQTVELTERGLGQITVFASDLSSGIYNYTLVADGVVVSTKKMVKTN